ncbi:probable disease resistance protein At4g27220 isoform X2 [Selaginella moellendorffii]|uniref:probable disease resistance protein At4g27220 isoform X2 n=1 Tax=Selaginella moellendorffii TaxID=88036 RepID=UPI000D1C44DD|nr:probable disease resistance protein At4g27220 isoform X2 [Selaginella moellendorffii]|eukprot:XP_024538933.1 probable disease resistance protein At4g27220 isoform X2 [Selaginella moellendorffii]
MVDPGFVSALIAEIVHLAIVEAAKVVMCREYCMQLAKMVDSCVKPVVSELGSLGNNPQLKNVADTWLASLRACLEDAQAVIIECRSVHSFNVFVKYRLSRRIMSILVKIKELHEAASTWNVALSAKVVTQCSEVLRLLQDNYRYVSLSAKTCGCTQSESYSKDRAIFEITNEATSHSAGLDVVDEPTTELQPIPKLVFGLEELSSRLEAVLRDGTGRWVGVWGKGGSGKTLLTQTVTNSLSVNNHFGGKVYWLTVARNPNIARLQSRLRKHIGRGEQLFSSEEAGRKTLINCLKNSKVLLILDDVWDGNVLQWFDVVDAPGSKILLTSRNNSVFDKVPSTVIEVKLLSDEHSWNLFCGCAFPGQDRQQLEHDMEPILAERVKQVVSECKGLPLALKVIGGSMAGKQQLGDWDSTLRKLKNAEVLNEEQENQVYHRLKLSYDELDMIDKARGRALQECFLYFAAFPEDAVIEVEQLIGYWIGDGLIGYKDDEDPQVEAYYILGQLIGRSLVDLEVGWTYSQNTKFLSCKIHDVLRDMAIYILENQKKATEYACLFLSGREFPAGLCKGTGQEKFNAKKLSLIGNQVENVDKLGTRAPDVEVLLLSNNIQLKHLTGRFLWSFKKLRVLDLSRTGLISLPMEIGKLKELVVLDISYSSIRSVPDSLGRLVKLEHLNMQNCPLKSFPVHKVSNLVNLRYLNTRGCGDIWDQNRHSPCSCVTSELPIQGLKNLAALQMLTRLWISSRTTERFPAISSTRLVHLSLYFEQLSVIPDELQSLAALEVLDVNTCRLLQKLPDYLAKSFLGLLALDLRGCTSLSQLPSDLQELQWLQKLDLEGCLSLQSLPEAFGSSGAFPSLQELFMTGCRRLEAFPELQPGALPRLRMLKLPFCARLQHLDIHPKALPNLVHLNLGGCAGLKELPDEEALRYFSYLEELVLNNTQISSLPASIGLLPRLKKLDLKQCMQLRALPWVDLSGDYFISLEEISMQGIPIRELPKVLAAAPQLRKMDLTDCDFITLTDEVFGLLKTRNVNLIRANVQIISALNEAEMGHEHEADKEPIKQKPETGKAAENTSETNTDQHESATVLDPSSSKTRSTTNQHSTSFPSFNNFLDWLAGFIDETSIDEDVEYQKLAKDANGYDPGHVRRVDLRDMKLQLFKRGLEDHLVLGSCSGDVITEEVLKNLACTSWNVHSYVGARFLANGFFELAFANSLDVQKLLEKRFAQYEDRVILFQPFQQDFNPNEVGNIKAAVWVGLPLLPTDCLHPKVLKAVGNALGSYLAYELDGGRLPRVCFACTIQQERELPSELELVLPSGKVWLQRLVWS